MKIIARWVAAFCVVGLLGCGGEQGSPQSSQGAVEGRAADTDLAVAVDMCREHGVLEAVCTKCNPQLVPVFQAKGDWCAEHGFPESFCPTCHPEKGGRPQLDVANDGAPADGMIVKLKSARVGEQIGIETSLAEQATDGGMVIATAMIVPDPSKHAQVSVPEAGVVREISASIGSPVDKGTALAVIESSSLAELRSRLRESQAHVAVAGADYDREKELFARGISTSKQVQAAEREYEAAKAEVASAVAGLEMSGVGEGVGGRYELRSPIAGVVTENSLSVGAFVDAEDAAFIEVINTATLWAEIDVPESHAGEVAVGQGVLLEVQGIEGAVESVIEYVAPVIDSHKRTVSARARVDNRRGLLRANMYARVRILTKSAKSAVWVPRGAVQDAKGVKLVFIPTAEAEYRTRRVHILPSDGERIAVVDGLDPGESVVTTGSFLLMTETLKGSIGAGCCEVGENPAEKKSH